MRDPDGTYVFMAGVIGATLVIIIAIMASCDKHRETEHTKQAVAGLTNAANHPHLP